MPEVQLTQQQRDTVSRLRFAGWNIGAITRRDDGRVSVALKHHRTDETAAYVMNAQGKRA